MTEGFGHEFQNPELLRQALRHRSAGVPHNERMEFLGDALVNLIVAEALHFRWPKADEGALTRARASLVRESSLAAIARQLGLGESIKLGPGEMKTGGHRRDSILADALEAIVAAIHLDVGFDRCRAAVLPWFEPMLAELPIGKVEKDAKTRLQEWLQARQLDRPEYTLVSSSGEEHARIFLVRCGVAPGIVAAAESADPGPPADRPPFSAEGEGSSLRAAEQAAAALVLAQIEVSKQ